jgi:hypothetical protein
MKALMKVALSNKKVARHLSMSKVMSKLDRGLGSTAYELHLPRIVADKESISEKDFSSFGFKPTLLSIPEPGQARQKSWRHPEGYHVHDHGEAWIFHKDQHAPDISSPISTFKHVITEGLPGAKKYVEHRAYDKRRLLDIVGKNR